MEGHVPMLRFQEKNIRAIARRYDYPIAERELIELKPIVRGDVNLGSNPPVRQKDGGQA